jgi:thioredoxin-like negative regulator of GroEL
MDAALDALEPRFTSRARFVRINIDEKPELFQHDASGGGIPQIMIFRDGRIIDSQLGFGGDEALQKWLSENL